MVYEQRTEEQFVMHELGNFEQRVAPVQYGYCPFNCKVKTTVHWSAWDAPMGSSVQPPEKYVLELITIRIRKRFV